MSNDQVPPAHVLRAGIQELTRREELLTREYENNARLLARALDNASDARGVGRAADGAIVATVSADHRLVDLVLDPPALRLGSIARLRDELMTAVNAAIDDVGAQGASAGSHRSDAVGALLDRMPEVTAQLPDTLVTRLRTPPAPRPVPVDPPDWHLDA